MNKYRYQCPTCHAVIEYTGPASLRASLPLCVTPACTGQYMDLLGQVVAGVLQPLPSVLGQLGQPSGFVPPPRPQV